MAQSGGDAGALEDRLLNQTGESTAEGKQHALPSDRGAAALLDRHGKPQQDHEQGDPNERWADGSCDHGERG